MEKSEVVEWNGRERDRFHELVAAGDIEGIAAHLSRFPGLKAVDLAPVDKRAMKSLANHLRVGAEARVRLSWLLVHHSRSVRLGAIQCFKHTTEVRESGAAIAARLRPFGEAVRRLWAQGAATPASKHGLQCLTTAILMFPGAVECEAVYSIPEAVRRFVPLLTAERMQRFRVESRAASPSPEPAEADAPARAVTFDDWKGTSQELGRILDELLKGDKALLARFAEWAEAAEPAVLAEWAMLLVRHRRNSDARRGNRPELPAAHRKVLAMIAGPLGARLNPAALERFEGNERFIVDAILKSLLERLPVDEVGKHLVDIVRQTDHLTRRPRRETYPTFGFGEELLSSLDRVAGELDPVYGACHRWRAMYYALVPEYRRTAMPAVLEGRTASEIEEYLVRWDGRKGAKFSEQRESIEWLVDNEAHREAVAARLAACLQSEDRYDVDWVFRLAFERPERLGPHRGEFVRLVALGIWRPKPAEAKIAVLRLHGMARERKAPVGEALAAIEEAFAREERLLWNAAAAAFRELRAAGTSAPLANPARVRELVERDPVNNGKMLSRLLE